MGLKQITQSCEEIAKDLVCNNYKNEKLKKEMEKKLYSILKYKSCVHSDFPERMWCEELKKPALFWVCGECLIYQPRNNNLK